MLKIFKCFMIAFSTVAIVSCADEMDDPNSNSDQEQTDDTQNKPGGEDEVTTVSKTFAAFRNDGVADALEIAWKEADMVSVFSGTGAHTALPISLDTEGAASFSGEVEKDGPYYAVVPYNESDVIEDGKIVLTIPSEQTPAADYGNVDPAAAIAVGRADAEDNVYFSDVCGYLKVVIEEAGVCGVTVTASSALAGKVLADCSESMVVTPAAEEGAGSVSIRPESGETFSAGTYYVAVLPGTYSGLNISFDGVEEDECVVISEEVVVEASKISDIEDALADAAYGIVDAASLNAFFAKASASGEENPVKGIVLNDIDLSNAEIVPASNLYGELDGKNFKLKNWTNKAGTLISLNSGIVKNLIIDESCTLTAPAELTDADFGVLITRQASVGSCIGCKNFADISVAPTSMPGNWRFSPMIGCNDQGYIEGCENHGDITITLNGEQTGNFVVGGVCGYCKGKVTAGEIVAFQCRNLGNIVFDAKDKVKMNSIGGVIGATPVHGSEEFKNTGLFKECTNSGNLTYTVAKNGSGSYANIGGVIGYCEGDMESCSNAGIITHTNNVTDLTTACTRPAVGGVAGCVGYSMKNCSNSGKVVFSGVAANGTAGNDFAGGYAKPAFGGVVGVIGDAVDVAASVLQNCDNSGQMEITAYMVEGHSAEPLVGGIAGYARVAVSACDNTAEKMIVNMYGKYNCVGGVVGRMWGNCTLTSCSNASDMTVSTEKTADTNQGYEIVVGGVVGRDAAGTDSSINTGDIVVNASGAQPATTVGGIVGLGKGSMKKGDNRGAITLNEPTGAVNAGGVVGNTDQAVSGSSNSGDITVGFSTSGSTAFSYIGGIAGKSGSMTDCDNSGNLTTSNRKVRLAGLVAQAGGEIKDCNVIESTITLNTATAGSEVGGLAAYHNFNVTNCTFKGMVTTASADVYAGGFVATVRNDKSPVISNSSLNASLVAPQSGTHGIIYGGQIGDKTTAGTITIGTAENPVSIKSGSTFKGAAVTSSTTLVGVVYDSPKSTVNSNVVIVESLPTDAGASTSRFDAASNWNGVWN